MLGYVVSHTGDKRLEPDIFSSASLGKSVVWEALRLISSVESSAMQRGSEGTTVACPFVYGSIAHWMGKKADEFATHKWTLYVRGPNMEDMSSFISKVVFTLHPSFAAPIREISDPPYQVSEFGWGEFEAGIRVFFRDPEEQPIDLIHQIKLYPAVPEGADSKPLNAPPVQNSKKPVVAEQYDEAVFTDPNESFMRLLMLYSASSSEIRALDAVGMEHYTRFDETADLEQLAFIQDHIRREMDLAKIRLLQLDAEINQILSDPNATLKPSTLALPAPAASLVFVPSSFSPIIAEGMAPTAVTSNSKPAQSSGVSGGEKAPPSGKNSRGGAVAKVPIGKGATAGPSPPASNAGWSAKSGAAPGGQFPIPPEADSASGTAALSKKKAQASAAAAAAVKQMEQLSSVRM